MKRYRNALTTTVRTVAALALAATVMSPPDAAAQSTLRIAAIVNGDVISIYDLEARLSLIIATSGMEDRVEVRRRMSAQVLRSLIDEKLKLQEAKRLGIQVTKEDVDRALRQVATQNKTDLQQLDQILAQQGVRKADLVDKIQSDVAWVRVVSKGLRTRVEIDAQTVDQFLARSKANEGKLENRVAEIFLPVDGPKDEAPIREVADRLSEQIRAGANFGALAQSFSQSVAAAVTGDLGWVREGELDEALNEVVARLEPGQTSAPVRSVSGFHILQVMARRKASGIGGEPSIELQQILLPLSNGAPPAEVERQMKRVAAIAPAATSCADMDRLGKEIGPDATSGNMGTLPLSRLAPELRAVVTALPDGKASEPLRTGAGILMVMVCKRSGGDLTAEDREHIREMLYQQRMDEAAQRYLRDLRRTAFVDVRL